MNKRFGIFFGLAIFITATMSWAADLTIVHTDAEWKGGKGNVPEKGICFKHGGKSWSPPLKISGIPVSTKSIKLLFSDDEYGSEGGHGDFTVKINGQSTIEIPPIGGDKNYLPANITGGEGHHCSDCMEKDYLGPCSGGKLHTYRVIIHARNSEESILAKGTVSLGDF
jgi:phosphatidylethanolamine-binding protein (PEBP) family uncharacterized protein